jgi:hypothetical protein
MLVNPRTIVYLFDQKPMMIKHTLSLSIDNSDDDWICVHTPIPDYQMAYRINKVFSVRLRRRPKDYVSQKSKEHFPIFSYQKRKEGVHWHLIRNKVKTNSSVGSESLLFSSSETHYLFKKLTGVDYLLSVGTKVSESVQKKLAELPEIQSCYSLPKQVSHLKQQLSF